MEQKHVSVVYNGNIISLTEKQLIKHPDGYMFYADSFRLIPSVSKMPEIMLYMNNIPYVRAKKKIIFDGLDNGKRTGELTIRINGFPYKVGTWKEV